MVFPPRDLCSSYDMYTQPFFNIVPCHVWDLNANLVVAVIDDMENRIERKELALAVHCDYNLS